MQSQTQFPRYARISSADLAWNLAPVSEDMVNTMDRLSFILSEPKLEPRVVEQELSSKKGNDSLKRKHGDTTSTTSSRKGSDVESGATDSVDDDDIDSDKSESVEGEYDSDDSDWKTMSQARHHFARKRAEEAKIPEAPLGLTEIVTAFRGSSPGSTWNKNADRRERFNQRIVEDLGSQYTYNNEPSHVVKLGDGTEMGLKDIVGSRIPNLVDLPDTISHWTSFCTYAYSLFADAEDRKETEKKGSTSFGRYRLPPSSAYDDQAKMRWTMFWNLLGQTTPSGTEGRPKFVYHGTDEVMSNEEEVFTTLLKMAVRGPDEVQYPDGKVETVKREEAPSVTRHSQPSGETWHKGFTEWKSKAVEEERMRWAVPQSTTDWSTPVSEKTRSGSSWWRSRS